MAPEQRGRAEGKVMTGLPVTAEGIAGYPERGSVVRWNEKKWYYGLIARLLCK